MSPGSENERLSMVRISRSIMRGPQNMVCVSLPAFVGISTENGPEPHNWGSGSFYARRNWILNSSRRIAAVSSFVLDLCIGFAALRRARH